MKLTVKEPLKWAHRHVDVKEYVKGDVIETDDDDLIKVSLQEGWTVKAKAKDEPAERKVTAPAEAAAHDAAPETKTD